MTVARVPVVFDIGALEQPDTDDPAVLPIRAAASMAGVHPQTLRDYERRGLLRPARTDGGMRLYRHRDVQRAERIKNSAQPAYPFTPPDGFSTSKTSFAWPSGASTPLKNRTAASQTNCRAGRSGRPSSERAGGLVRARHDLLVYDRECAHQTGGSAGVEDWVVCWQAG